jgi:hypothetical protein
MKCPLRAIAGAPDLTNICQFRSQQTKGQHIWDGVDSWKLSGKGRVFKFPQWIHLAELQSLASSGMCDIASAVPSEGGNCNLYGKYVAA